MISPALLEEAVSAGIDAALRTSRQQGRLVGLDAADVMQSLHRHFAELVPTLRSAQHRGVLSTVVPEGVAPSPRRAALAGVRSTFLFALLDQLFTEGGRLMTVRQRIAVSSMIPDQETRSRRSAVRTCGRSEQCAGQQRDPSRPVPDRRLDRPCVRCRVLSPLINIDPAAVAVINGQIVDDDTVLDAEQGMLSFVKPSSLKG